MKRWEICLGHLSVAAVGVTGVVYGVMKYFLVGGNPDSPLGSPWQPAVLKAHILAAPVAVFALALIFRAHAIVRLRNGEPTGRGSGIGLVATAAPLVFSGYLVQVFVGGDARRWCGWIHAGIGVAFVAAYFGHRFRPDEDDRESPG